MQGETARLFLPDWVLIHSESEIPIVLVHCSFLWAHELIWGIWTKQPLEAAPPQSGAPGGRLRRHSWRLLHLLEQAPSAPAAPAAPGQTPKIVKKIDTWMAKTENEADADRTRTGRGPDADRTRAWPFLPGGGGTDTNIRFRRARTLQSSASFFLRSRS
eukprot:gene15564-biopygen11243